MGIPGVIAEPVFEGIYRNATSRAFSDLFVELVSGKHMTQPSYTIIRLCQPHLRKVFWAERLWEKYFSHELDIVLPKRRPKNNLGPEIAWSDEVLFVNPVTNEEVMRGHWYLDVRLEIAGSGQPDPKEIMLGSTNYRIWRRGDPPCRMCPFWERARVHITNWFWAIWDSYAAQR